jgi:hypothetical protein
VSIIIVVNALKVSLNALNNAVKKGNQGKTNQGKMEL